jgi:hypothetical protein
MLRSSKREIQLRGARITPPRQETAVRVPGPETAAMMYFLTTGQELESIQAAESISPVGAMGTLELVVLMSVATGSLALKQVAMASNNLKLELATANPILSTTLTSIDREARKVSHRIAPSLARLASWDRMLVPVLVESKRDMNTLLEEQVGITRRKRITLGPPMGAALTDQASMIFSKLCLLPEQRLTFTENASDAFACMI